MIPAERFLLWAASTLWAPFVPWLWVGGRRARFAHRWAAWLWAWEDRRIGRSFWRAKGSKGEA